MDKPAARSAYRQIRVTFTEEAHGRWSARVLVKGVSQPWQASQVHAHLTGVTAEHTADINEALMRISGILLRLAGASPPG